jgi:hypothetical protein
MAGIRRKYGFRDVNLFRIRLAGTSRSFCPEELPKVLHRCSTCNRLFEATAAHIRDCPACRPAMPADDGPPALVRRAPLIIEGEVIRRDAPSRPPARAVAESLPTRPEMRFLYKPAPKRFRGLAVTALLLLVAGVAVPVAAAIPGVTTLFAKGEAIVLDRVESTTMVVAGENALVVTGTLTNPTARELPVPAVKVALRAGNDDDAFAWTVEPATLVLAPGASVGFRSMLKNPISGPARIVVSLVPREQRIGMR